MFNPFDEKIYEEVIKKLALQIAGDKNPKERFLICYGGANLKAVIDSGVFSLIREDRCPHRGSIFRVFKTIH